MPCVNTRGQNELPATFTLTRRAGGRGALTRTPSHPQVSADRPAAVTASTPADPNTVTASRREHMMVAYFGKGILLRRQLATVSEGGLNKRA